ncbi:MAG: DUF2332 domain-containing protein [Opitutales bacterium]|nr:DUF2332 domain-containing protein [Opitutales bacterium]NRA26235.1 DUF2332 domain-containing protein [Opitutales bacterium]
MDSGLSERFQHFGEKECPESSPLYAALALEIAKDTEMLALVAECCRPEQPPANMLFGATQYVLAKYPGNKLAEYFPWLSKPAKSPDGAYSAFRSFIFEYRESVATCLQNRRVQTNEVRRCVYLLPIFLSATQGFDNRSIALIEIGCSAGLNLFWDQYAYDYGNGVGWGNTSSPITLESRFEGETPDIFSRPAPMISHRIGLDLNTISATDDDERAWLMALVWPELIERRSRLEAALYFTSEQQLDLREGDGFVEVDDIITSLPDNVIPAIYHTHVANQISQDARKAFLQKIERIGRTRDLIHIHNNIKPGLNLSIFKGGEEHSSMIARAQPHGEWVKWLG